MAGNKHKGNGHDPRHVTETPDVSHIRNVDVTHEASDVSVSGILKFVLGLSLLGVAVFVLMWVMFRFFYAQAEKEPNPGPMAMKPEDRLPPEPRLQASKGFGIQLQNGQWVDLEKSQPDAEYRLLRDQWERQLNCTDAMPNCTPIDQAVDKVVSGGTLHVRPAEDAAKTKDAPRPSVWSSGRMAESGK
jgi:hypothetical protein